jgi:hypothetical protein
MAVGIDAASDAHLAVADALVRVWTLLSSTAQRSVQAELDQWDNADYPHTTAAEHLQYLQESLTKRLGKHGQGPLLAASLSPNLLENIYEAVSQRVFTLYGMTPPHEIPLRVRAAVDPIYQGPMPICACGAVADYGLDPFTKQLSVSVTLHPARLGPPTLASIPYLLCHELVCHVFQGADHDSEDPFAEGWMDRVALLLHQAWAQALFPRAPELARSQADELSSLVRMNLPGLTRGQPVTRAARRQGWEAAGMVNEILSRFDSGTAPPTNFQLLSIELNILRCDIGQRLNFVSAIRATVCDEALEYALARRLTDWVRGRCKAADVLFFAE